MPHVAARCRQQPGRQQSLPARPPPSLPLLYALMLYATRLGVVMMTAGDSASSAASIS